jgi:hypothetical protein
VQRGFWDCIGGCWPLPDVIAGKCIGVVAYRVGGGVGVGSRERSSDGQSNRVGADGDVGVARR